MGKKFLLSTIIIIALFLAAWYRPVATEARWCRFIALDIGQGDALLIQTSDGQDVLIDGGPGSSVVKKLEQHLPVGDDDLELVVSTHPDSDHLSGLVSVLENFSVRSLLTNGAVVSTKLYQRWTKVLEEHPTETRIGFAPQTYDLGKFLHLEVLWPDHDVSTQKEWPEPRQGVGGTNDSGIVLKMTCAGSSALLTADISHAIEETLTDRYDLHVSLLKVAHHGSRYSSDPKFLQEVSPDWAVISVSAKNGYGHPHPLALQRLEVLHFPILRTDLLGDVELQTDGQGGWRRVDQ